MSDTQRTFDDIIAEMKRDAEKIFPALPIAVLQLANRLEAAHDHDIAIATEASARAVVGACVKQQEAERKCVALREALLCIGHIAEYLEAGTVKDLNHAYRNIQDRVEIALATPPRTADECRPDFILIDDAHATTEKPSAVGNAAHRRELPQPDPDWAEICERCRDGEIEPKDCEYYSEPNGCNSPIYGQHPKSKPVGNSAKLREALKAIGDLCDGLMPTWDGAIGRIKDMAETALSAPPRNCDIYLTEEAVDVATVTVREDCKACSHIDMEAPCVFCMVRWLLAPAAEQEGGAK